MPTLTPALLALTLFPLPLFPDSGLGRSIVTTVLIGLVIMVVFNELFGWVLSGVVVPGYLAPILLIQPWSGCVIVLEALATHGLVRVFGLYLPRLGGWREFFGRDRFFAYLLFGTLVRMAAEGFLLDRVGALMNEVLGLEVDYRNSFYSVGLIVVPLLSNTLFKPGLGRGLVPVATSVGLCYVVIRFLLIPYTNFSISSFELAYGYYATDFFGNAKAYIVLLTTAYLASRNNLLYGLDYNGILIPSLMALAWFEPLKVLTTLVESVLILVLARRVAKLKLLQDVTIEAGRKLLLTFSIGYALKLALGVGAGYWDPGFDVTDLYGFGYLLPSLIAGKMWQKGSVGIVLRPMVQTSLFGAAAGSVLAKALLVVFPAYEAAKAPDDAPAVPIERVEPDLEVLLRLDKVRIVRREDHKGYDRIYDRERIALTSAVEQLQAAQAAGSGTPAADAALRTAAAAVTPAGYDLLRVRLATSGDEVYYLRERADAPGRLHGWGLYVLAAAPRTDLVIEVPRPIEEPLALELGALLFERLGARALLVAGAHPDASADGSADVLRSPRSLYHAIDRLHPSSQVCEVRTPPRALAAAGRDRRRGSTRRPAAPPPAPEGLDVYLDSSWPHDLDRRALHELFARWPRVVLPAEARYDDDNRQRELRFRPYATLVAGERAALAALARRRAAAPIPRERGAAGIGAALLARLRDDPGSVAPTGSGAYAPPTLGEIATLTDDVLGPLARAQLAAERGEDVDDLLLVTAPVAERLGLELVVHEDGASGERFAVLREPTAGAAAATARRHRGLFVYRLGPARAFAIEVPHPATEAHTLEAGCLLLSLLRARALVIGGTSRHANLDGSADVTDGRAIGSAFQVAHQALVRESDGGTLAASVRGFGGHQDPDLDVVLSTGHELRSRAAVPGGVLELASALGELDARVTLFDGSRSLLRFQGKHTAQWAYSEAHYPGTFVHVWLSRELREALRGGGAGGRRAALAPVDLGIPRVQGSLLAILAQALAPPPSRRETPAGGGPPEAGSDAAAAAVALAEALLLRHADTHNVAYIRLAADAAARGGARLIHVVDHAARREHLVLLPSAGDPRALVAVPPSPTLPVGLPEAIGIDRVLRADDPALYDQVLEAVRDGRDRIRVLRESPPAPLAPTAPPPPLAPAAPESPR